jgi:hypothetical protein
LGGQHIWARYKDHTISEVFFVTQVVYAKTMAEVKLQCAFATKKLISKLGNCFPSHELMDALEVVYPQYWLGLDYIEPPFSYTQVCCVPKKMVLRSFGFH